MSNDKGQKQLNSLHEVALLEVKKLIELMGIDSFGKFSLLVLENWTHDKDMTLETITYIIQQCPKYFMLASKAFVEGLGEEKSNEMFNVGYNDIIAKSC